MPLRVRSPFLRRAHPRMPTRRCPPTSSSGPVMAAGSVRRSTLRFRSPGLHRTASRSHSGVTRTGTVCSIPRRPTPSTAGGQSAISSRMRVAGGASSPVRFPSAASAGCVSTSRRTATIGQDASRWTVAESLRSPVSPMNVPTGFSGADGISRGWNLARVTRRGVDVPSGWVECRLSSCGLALSVR